MNGREDLQESKRRHRELTQLEATRSLRAYQREWFTRLRSEVIDGGRPLVIAGPNTPHEIFAALDLPYLVDVWYSGLVAARRQSARYSKLLSERGYHDGLSRYTALGLAVALDEDGEDKPWGGLPPPSLVTTSPVDRSAEVLAEHFGVPYIGIERPVAARPYPSWWDMARWAWEDLEETYRIDAMVDQYQDLIGACERLADRKLDLDRLREILARVNEQEECFNDVREVICRAPKLPVRLGEAMSQVMGIQWHRGSQWALAQARAFRDEVRARAADGLWVCPGERYRLMYVGAGLWQQLDFFAEFEESHGVVFARSNYLCMACDAYPRYGLGDPVRALAARYVTFNDRLHLPPWAGAWAVQEARTHRLCGAVQLDQGAGQKFIARALEQEGYPVLQFPADAVDARTWNHGKLRGLVADFIESRLAKTGSAR